MNRPGHSLPGGRLPIQQQFPWMGIGLYVCDQIIKNHGGTLWVESETGRGATFNFTLLLDERTTDEQ